MNYFVYNNEISIEKLCLQQSNGGNKKIQIQFMGINCQNMQLLDNLFERNYSRFNEKIEIEYMIMSMEDYNYLRDAHNPLKKGYNIPQFTARDGKVFGADQKTYYIDLGDFNFENFYQASAEENVKGNMIVENVELIPLYTDRVDEFAIRKKKE